MYVTKINENTNLIVKPFDKALDKPKTSGTYREITKKAAPLIIFSR